MRFAFLMLAAAVATANAASPSGPRVLLHGWDFLETTPEDILDNAASFAKLPIDGVMVTLPPTKQADGTSIGSLSLPQDVAWQYESLAKYESTLKAICASPSLHDSMLLCAWFYTKGPRFSLLDDAAWARFGGNMRMLARLAVRSGMHGICIDAEEYTKAKQWEPDSGQDYDTAARLARQRGREVFAGAFEEFPNAVVLSFWFYSHCWRCVNTPDPLATAKRLNDLWPHFINGMLDVLPKTAIFVDGDEDAYRYDGRAMFDAGVVKQTRRCARFVPPERLDKFFARQRIGFGQYVDSYTNPTNSYYSFGPVDGSRVNHLRQNFKAASHGADYVWLYGEHFSWINWDDTRHPKLPYDFTYERHVTWEDKLPGFWQAVSEMRDPAAAEKKKENRQ